MLHVLKTEEVLQLIDSLAIRAAETVTVSLEDALSRYLAEDITSPEDVPGFDRSTVDGYAVRASDTFGCSESIPALMPQNGEVLMGEDAGAPLPAGAARIIPTGGALPEGADAVVMKEYTEDYGDGTIGILRPVSPGENIIFRGDDVRAGHVVLPAGKRLSFLDIGALAAIGKTEIPVRRMPRVAILSTGDELVPADREPGAGQIRDVNSHMLQAFCREWGAEPLCLGIFPDDENILGAALDRAVKEADLILLSGGSSVGTKDAACRLIEQKGTLLMHGIAMKPGKPTILGLIEGKPVFGLPGHPAAAAFSARLFVSEVLCRLLGTSPREYAVRAVLSESLGANHGRTQYTAVRLVSGPEGISAVPVRGKSGLITTLSSADGYVCVPRECEGFPAEDIVPVLKFTGMGVF